MAIKNFTIKDFLALEQARGIRLVGGEGGQNRIITGVNIMDNPDTVGWLQEGELLLTTGYVFKDDPAFQSHLIKELAERNCAGLGLKTRRYFDTIPQHMIEQANQYDFPLLELPFQYSLSQIGHTVYQAILNRQTALLEKSQEIHKRFTDVSLAGGNLEEIVATLIQLINNPVLVLDSRWRLLSYIEHPQNPYPLADCLRLVKGQRVFSGEFTDGIPRETSQWEKSIKRVYNCQQQKVPCRIKPVAAAGNMYGFIVVWESVTKLNKLDYVAIEHASTVIALERMKQQAIEETKHRIRADFFDDLLAGKIESVNAVRTLGEIHGLYTDKPYICLVVEIYSDSGDKLGLSHAANLYTAFGKMLNSPSMYKGIGELVDKIASHQWGGAVSITRSNKIIIFLPVEDVGRLRTAKLESRALAANLHDRIKEQFSQVDFSVGIGRPCESVLDLKRSFLEAVEAIRMARKIALPHAVAHFEDFVVYHLLDSINNRQELERFFNNTVGKLVEYDANNNTDLVNTLEHFFACRGNMSAAAEKLFIHRNTMMYRLDKIKSILNVDLEDAEELLELHLGLRAMRLLSMGKKSEPESSKEES
jgi:purine catabolism regulator